MALTPWARRRGSRRRRVLVNVAHVDATEARIDMAVIEARVDGAVVEACVNVAVIEACVDVAPSMQLALRG